MSAAIAATGTAMMSASAFLASIFGPFLRFEPPFVLGAVVPYVLPDAFRYLACREPVHAVASSAIQSAADAMRDRRLAI